MSMPVQGSNQATQRSNIENGFNNNNMWKQRLALNQSKNDYYEKSKHVKQVTIDLGNPSEEKSAF